MSADDLNDYIPIEKDQVVNLEDETEDKDIYEASATERQVVVDFRPPDDDDIKLEVDQLEPVALYPQDDLNVPVLYLTGIAGSGKTFLIKTLIRRDPDFGILCSTTGISAINLGTTTINSVLGYFDTDSMEDAYRKGRLTKKLRDLAFVGYKNLILDEVSMMHKDQLGILLSALGAANEFTQRHNNFRMGLILTGDFAQLAPVPNKDPKTGKNEKTPWAFLSDKWEQFENNTVKLLQRHRQSDGQFLDVLNQTRCGMGEIAASLMDQMNVKYEQSVVDDFDGTTILAKNNEVDRHNNICAMKLEGRTIQQATDKWGIQRKEWKKMIADWQQFKIGSYVMLLANTYDYSAGKEMIFANGDCGHIVDYQEVNEGGYINKKFYVKLIRNEKVVQVEKLWRENEQRDKPDLELVNNPEWVKLDQEGCREPRRSDRKGHEDKWVVGGICYFPMRYAWAATTYKTQGLTLDNCQIDLRPYFLGSPNQLYVALSRCRTFEGLRLVGDRSTFIRRVNVDPLVKRWL